MPLLLRQSEFNRFFNLFLESGGKDIFLRNILLSYAHDYAKMCLRRCFSRGGWLGYEYTMDDVLNEVMVILLHNWNGRLGKWKTYHNPHDITEKKVWNVIDMVIKFTRKKAAYCSSATEIESLPEDEYFYSEDYGFEEADNRIFANQILSLSRKFKPSIDCFPLKYHPFIKEVLSNFNYLDFDNPMKWQELHDIAKKHNAVYGTDYGHSRALFIKNFFMFEYHDYIRERVFSYGSSTKIDE